MAAACLHRGSCIAPGGDFANKGQLFRYTCTTRSAHLKAFQSQSSKSIVKETASNQVGASVMLPVF